jgi:uncharacterized protein YcfJ
MDRNKTKEKRNNKSYGVSFLKVSSFLLALFSIFAMHAKLAAADPDTYTISGNLSGLDSGNQVTLQLNGANNLVLSSNSPFTFSTSLDDLSSYAVTVSSNPENQTCEVTNGSGTIHAANVSNISVTCSDAGSPGGGDNTYTIAGNLSGLDSGNQVTLRLNGANDLTLSSNSQFTFSTSLDDLSSYDVTVSSNPENQTCEVTNGSGTIDAANISNISVTCSDGDSPGEGSNTYTVSGNLSGLDSGNQVTLRLNGANNLVLSSNSPFTFSTSLDDLSPYSVTVFSNPQNQTCSVTGGSGTIHAGNISNVSVICQEDVVQDQNSDSGDKTPDINIPKPKARVNDNGRSLSSYFMDDKQIKLYSIIKSLAGGRIRVTKDGKLIASSRINSKGHWSVKISFNKTTTIKIYYYDSSRAEIGSKKYTIKIDSQSPIFTNIPLTAHERAGGELSWTATDNNGIDHYRYWIDGKVRNTHQPHFHLSNTISVGPHEVDITAVDKAGNSTTAHLILWVW